MRVSPVLFPVGLLLLVHCVMGEGDSCFQKEEFDFRPDSNNCSMFYRCVITTLHTHTCGPGTVFNEELKTCVLKGSSYDKCSFCQENPAGLKPDEDKCSLYYNCSAPPRRIEWKYNLQECDHPQVYNPDTQRCEHYTMVECGEREMPLGICDYQYSQCHRAHCQPCNSKFPTCKDLPDGLHARYSNVITARFFVCVDERLVYEGECINTDHGEQIFHPEKRTCVFLSDI